MQAIDINCDMGERTSCWPYHIDNDIALLPYLSSINIACGFHAGDATTMHALVDAALTAGIAIGAHPGFADKENFGRSELNLSSVQIYDLIVYQLGALDAFLKINGTKLRHVKPHGALYNMAAKDIVLASAVCKAVKEFDGDLILYGLSGSKLIQAAGEFGLKNYCEVFADRTYQDDGSLTPRSANNTLITNEADCLQQVLQIATGKTVKSVNGKTIPVQADTICIHSDGAHALAFAKRIFETLNKKNIAVQSL